MKKTIFIIVTILFAVASTAIQVKIVQNTTARDDSVAVIVFAETLGIGQTVQENHLREATMPLSLLPAGYGTQKDLFVGKYLTRNVYKGEVALMQTVTEVNAAGSGMLPMENDNHVLISLKPDADRSVAWQLRPDQYVDLLFIPRKNEEAVFFRMENIRIAGVVDDNLMPLDYQDEKPVKPIYLVFEVTPKQAEIIATAKQGGYFEVIGKKQDAAGYGRSIP